VTRWLDAHKISHKISQTRHIVEAVAPVAAIEALLHCELHVFETRRSRRELWCASWARCTCHTNVADVVSVVFNVAGKGSQTRDAAIIPLSICAFTDPPLSRKGRIHRKSHAGSTSKMPKGLQRRFVPIHFQSCFQISPPLLEGRLFSPRDWVHSCFSYESSSNSSSTGKLFMILWLLRA